MATPAHALHVTINSGKTRTTEATRRSIREAIATPPPNAKGSVMSVSVDGRKVAWWHSGHSTRGPVWCPGDLETARFHTQLHA